MAEKILNTRIQLKYDTYTNWLTKNPVLKKGEVAIATIESNSDGVQNAPSVLIKVGDGTSNYKTLKFVSGMAADVYSWAKSETKPAYAASEITGLSDYISDKVQDTDTQYKIIKIDDYNYKLQSKTLNGSWTDVTDGTIVIPKYDDTALKTSIDTLVGSDTNKSARTIASEEVAKIVAGADESFDTLKEISDWITSHKSDATEMNSAILALENILDGIGGEGEKPTVVAYVTDAIAALKIGDYAKAADLTKLAESAVTDVTTTENGGLKVSTTGTTRKIDIDDTITFVFNCGNATL